SGRGANINAVALGTGDGGIVSIDAGTVTVKGPLAAISARNFGAGRGGSVRVEADTVDISHGGTIEVSTFGAGAGGDVRVEAYKMVLSGGGVEGFTGVSAVAEPGATGAAGDIVLTIGATFESTDASVSAAASQSDGGNIQITATQRVHLIDSSIETAVRGGAGRGGNISIDPDFVVLENSRIIANAFGGPGGNIDIVAGNFIADPLSVVEASSAAGIDGTVTIDSPDVEITGAITLLPGAFFDAATLLRAPCAARAQTGSSSLSVAGRSGLPVDPDVYLPSPSATPSQPSHATRGSNPRAGAQGGSATTPGGSRLWASMDSDCDG
ncbi:MAG: hypothetical protein ACR2RL_03890, partial [Gammaproteobacteria bacterium]